MTSPSRRRIKLGDVFAIPLPNGKYAFGRRFKDAAIAVYQDISDSIHDVPKDEKYRFIVGVYDSVLKSGEWPFVENRPFPNEEEAWPPPACVVDKLTGRYSIYHKGEFHDATESDCAGLERAAIWDRTHIVDRIMGSDKWNKL